MFFVGVLVGWFLGVVSMYVVLSVLIKVWGIFLIDYVVVVWSVDYYIGVVIVVMVVVFVVSWLFVCWVVWFELVVIIWGVL